MDPGATVRLVVPFAKQRPRWLLQERTLDRMTTPEQFEEFVAREQPELFLRYRASAPLTRAQFEETAARFGITFDGRRVLDIGPGYGEALDVAHEQGASTVDFIELEPVFYTFNRLKQFPRPHRFNHALGLAGRLKGRLFDFIWARGSHVPDQFAAAPWLLERWVRDVDRVVAPGGQVLVVPFWESHDGQRLLDLEKNPFSQQMMAAGYEMVDAPSERIGATAYPVVYRLQK
jgi:SAM-dependent methyltransferase